MELVNTYLLTFTVISSSEEIINNQGASAGNTRPGCYLVMHTQSYDLGQEGSSEAGSDQLLVGSSERGLIETLANQSPCKLIHL